MATTISFQGIDCTAEIKQYSNNSIAIILLAANTPGNELQGIFAKQQVCTATINVPELSLQPPYACIKDYSENQGVFDALLRAGVIEDSEMEYPLPWASVRIAKVLVTH